jgi:hypothetical protein
MSTQEAGAREGVAITRGEMDPSKYRVHTPAKINVKARSA